MEPQSVMTAVPQEEEEEPSREAHLEPQEAPASDRAPRPERKSCRRPRRERVPADDSDPQPRHSIPATSLRGKEAMKPPAKSLTEEDAMELLSEVWIWKEKNQKWKHIGKVFMITGASIYIGAEVAGPLGVAVGIPIGGLLGARRWWRYKSVPQKLKELTPTEKKNLRRQVMAIVRALEWTDFEELTEQVMKNKAVQEKLWELTMCFVTQKGIV